VAGVAAVLGDYPPEVVQAVVDPRRGLPSKTNWIPTIAEVKSACEQMYAPIEARIERQRLADERRALLSAPVLPRKERPTLDELRQRYGGESWGISHSSARREEKPAKSLAELEAARDSFVVEDSPELKAAIGRILSGE